MTLHPRLAANSLSTATWTIDQDLDLYARLGVHTAGIYFDKLEQRGLHAAVDLVRQSGVRVAHVFTRGVTLHDRTRWPDEQARLSDAIDVAVTLGAGWLGLTAGPAGPLDWDEAAASLGDALAPLRERGVGLAVEHSLPIRVEIGFVHSLRDCVDLADRLDLGVIMETNYCFAERDLAATIAAGAPRLATVQVSDLVPPSTTVPDRAVPGDGVIPMSTLLRLVLDTGYAGPVELEMLGPRIEAEGYEPALRRGLTAVDAILRELDQPAG